MFTSIVSALLSVIVLLFWASRHSKYWRNKSGKLILGESLSFSFGSLHQPVFLGQVNHALHSNLGVYFVRFLFRKILIVASARIAKDFYKDALDHVRDPSFVLLGESCSALMGHSLGVTHGKDEWRRIRNPFMHHFSPSALEKYFNIIKDCTSKWIGSINGSFHVYEDKLSTLPLNIISKLIYGDDLKENDIKFIEYMSNLHAEIVERMLEPSNHLPLLSKHCKQKAQQFLGKWKPFNREFMKKYEEDPKERDNIFYLMAKELKENNNSITEDEFLDTMDEILLLNFDVTFVAIGWVCVNLAKNQKIQEKLRAEIQAFCHRTPLESLTRNDLDSMLYLDSVVKESARLCPSLALSFPEKTAVESELGGYLIPAGTTVLMDIFSINRDPEVFPYPNEFRPEENNAQNNSNFHRFGLGPRKCLGFRYADAMIKIFLVQILSKYQLTLDSSISWDEKATRTKGLPFFTPYTNFPRIFCTYLTN